MCQNPHGSTVQRGKMQFYHIARGCRALAADFYLGGTPPPDFTCFFHFVSCFILGRILERFWTLSGASFLSKIWKTRVPVQHEEGLRKGFQKKCDLGTLQTSKTRSACRREHDSVVLLDSRKSLILDAFWNSILEPLGPSCAENMVF